MTGGSASAESALEAVAPLVAWVSDAHPPRSDHFSPAAG